MVSSAETGSRGGLEDEVRSRWGWTPYRLLLGFTFFACAFAIICDVAMWFIIDDYNPIAQTISELAAGPYHWIQDTGLVVFVLGVLTLAAALTLRGKGSARSWVLRASFVLIAIDLSFIALWNEYGDGEPGGLEIHRFLLLLLYPLIPLTLWLGTSVTPAKGHDLDHIGTGAAIGWLVLAPIFFILPDSVDGGYERLLALFMVGAVLAAAYPLYRDPREED